MITGTRYEYGIFNADKAKISAANDVSPDDEDWDWLWTQPIGYEWDETKAKARVQLINFERAEDGKLSRFGPVKYRKRLVSFGDWEDVD